MTVDSWNGVGGGRASPPDCEYNKGMDHTVKTDSMCLTYRKVQLVRTSYPETRSPEPSVWDRACPYEPYDITRAASAKHVLLSASFGLSQNKTDSNKALDKGYLFFLILFSSLSRSFWSAVKICPRARIAQVRHYLTVSASWARPSGAAQYWPEGAICPRPAENCVKAILPPLAIRPERKRRGHPRGPSRRGGRFASKSNFSQFLIVPPLAKNNPKKVAMKLLKW
jgi:hypothetical protein